MQQLPGCKMQLNDHSWENRVAQRPDTTVVGLRIEGKLKTTLIIHNFTSFDLQCTSICFNKGGKDITIG